MRILSFGGVLALLALAACGSSGNADQQARQCAPSSVAGGFKRFLEQVGNRQRRLALQSIAKGQSLRGVTIFHGAGVGEGRVDAETPQAVYAGVAGAIPREAPVTLLAAGVGSDAPFAVDYQRSHAGSHTAGVEFVAEVGSEFLSGKVGIDCGRGELYVGAMNVTPSLGRRQLCGRYVTADSEKKTVCRL